MAILTFSILFTLIQLCTSQGPCPFNSNTQFVFQVGSGQGVWCSQPGASINMNNGVTTCSPGLTFTCDLSLPRTGTIGQDLFGGDLVGMPLIVSSSGACYQRCAQTQGCVAWAFNYCGSTLQCWLKGSVPSTRIDSCVVSAVFVAPPSTPRPTTLVPSTPPPPTTNVVTLPPYTGSSCTCSCCLGNGCVASFQGYSGFDCSNCDASCSQGFPSQCPSNGNPGVVASFCVDTTSLTSSGGSSPGKIGPFKVGVFIAIIVGGLVGLALIALLIAAVILGWHRRILDSYILRV